MICVLFCFVSSLQQGSRSSSSACGSADVLEALGVVIDLGPQVSGGANISVTTFVLWKLITCARIVCLIQ